MPLFVSRLAVLALGLTGPPGGAADLPAAGEVVVATLEVFDEPSPTAIASGLLVKGNRVIVHAVGKDGWATIEAGSPLFRWIDEKAIDAKPGEPEAQVVAARVRLRAGLPGAQMPGVPRETLIRGARVKLLLRPPLTIGQGKAAKTWRAVEPPSGGLAYVLSQGLEWAAPGSAKRTPEVAKKRDEHLLEASAASLPPEIATELTHIEQSHRAALRGPIDQWHLEPIRQRYQALLKRATDASSGNAIRERLALLDQHLEMAQAASRIESILDRSRARDRKLALFLRRLTHAEHPLERPYVAEGLVQPSSRMVGGQKVFALIGPEGTTLAYLDLPAGLDASHLVARRVGVRGSIHYDEDLRARLIAVEDIDPLERLR